MKLAALLRSKDGEEVEEDNGKEPGWEADEEDELCLEDIIIDGNGEDFKF
jgi:hypothetical protein